MKRSRELQALTLGFLGLSLLALAPHDVAPPFKARNQDGKTIQLSDFQGKPVLLYFYPKDDTPGCTKEACAFRDAFTQIRKYGAVVFGVSRQDEKSHQAFRARHHLPFDLLVDADGKIGQAYGVGLMPVIGFHKRQSVLIGRDGRIAKVYGDVNPEKHAAEILQDLEKLPAK